MFHQFGLPQQFSYIGMHLICWLKNDKPIKKFREWQFAFDPPVLTIPVWHIFNHSLQV